MQFENCRQKLMSMIFRRINTNVALIIVFTSILFFYNLGRRDLWAPDEPRYSEVAKEMWEGKDFVLPHLNGEKYPDKPPILFWLIILFSIPFGAVTELSSRLPSAFAGIGCAVMTYYLGRQIFSNLQPSIATSYSNATANYPFIKEDRKNSKTKEEYPPHPLVNPERIGLLAALILSTNLEYLINSRRVSFDVLLTALITLALLSFHTGFSQKKGNTKYFLLSYLLMAIATLTKGPVGFVIPILVISSFLCVLKLRNRLNVHGQTRPFTDRLSDLAIPSPQMHNTRQEFSIPNMRIGLGCVIIFSIPLLWVFGIYVQGGWEHTKEVVFHQNLGRTVDSWSHKQPFYYFFIQFLLEFLPWSIFIPSVIIYLLRLRPCFMHRILNISLDIIKSMMRLATRILRRIIYKDQPYSPKHIWTPSFNPQSQSQVLQPPICPPPSSLLFPSIWFIVVFTFFSFMSGKRSGYILPLYPAASILVAWFMDSFISCASDKRFRRIGYLPFRIAFWIISAIGIGLPVWVYYYHRPNLASIIPISIIFVTGPIVASRYLSSARLIKVLTASFIILLVTVMIGSHLVIPIINERKSARHFCEKIKEFTRDGSQLASYNFLRDAYLFYTGRKHIKVIIDIKELKGYLESKERVYLIIKEDDMDEIRENLASGLRILAREDIGHRSMCLISN